MEICVLCCNFALGTLDPQDSGTSEEHGNADDLPTLRTQRRKDIAFGRVLTFDNWIVEPAVFGHWIL